MTRIGVGVEGPSDLRFWQKVLHRHCENVSFDIRVMHGRGKLIRGADDLLRAFTARGCRAVFFLVDKDDDPCLTGIREEFAEELRERFGKSDRKPECHLCITDRELESWYLAEEMAMRQILGTEDYTAALSETKVGGKSKLTALLRRYKSTGFFNELAFAQRIAPIFQPEIARLRSVSFEYFWSKLKASTLPPFSLEA